MYLKLVTSHQGVDHVDAEQQADLQAGIVGNDLYVMNVGEKMRAEAVTANKIRIFDGTGLWNGREFYIEAGAYDDVEIENGTQGLLRNDFITLKYKKDESTGIEGITYGVLKGQTGETAVDPIPAAQNIREGAMESEIGLYRVRLNGLAIEAVEPLYDFVMSAKEMGDMITELNRKLYTPNYNAKQAILTATGASFTAPNNGVIRFCNRAAIAGAFYEYLIRETGTGIASHIYGADCYSSGEFIVCRGDIITCRYVSLKSSVTTFIPYV